ncbi:MAG: MBL fold metallo-hydrolase, partial [Pirellulales bacterium]
GRRVLLDCGLYQGRRKEAFEINRQLPFAADTIDAVVLSHAHIDHSGNLPSLVRAGFRGKIYCTDATRDLCAHMLLDSAKIQESDVRYVNKKRKREGRALFEPLYEKRDAARTLRQFRSRDYDTPFEVVPGFTATLIDAGHMLGSASVVLDVEEDGRRQRLVFSGDIGNLDVPILRDPQIAPRAEWLIMESTYGDRDHGPRSEVDLTLERMVERTHRTGGKLIIPAFAVGRTQEIVYRLNLHWESGDMPPVSTFVDSPLAVNVTEVFRAHPECYNDAMLEAVLAEEDEDPLGFERLHYVRSSAESKALNTSKQPAIIISASGMCEAGRVLHHLKNHIGDPDSAVLFAGYQAQHTLGRKILEGTSPVPILGGSYEVRAEIDRLEGLSGHADQAGLLDWANQTAQQGRLQGVFLVHGEADAAAALAAALRAAGLPRIEIPQRGDSFACEPQP